MAKVKRVSRSDARRRYRSEQSTGSDAAVVGTAAATGAAAASGQAARSGSAGATGRPGMVEGLRLAYNKPDYRTDLRALPVILLSRAVLIPSALVVVSGILLMTPFYDDTLVRLFVGAFVMVPPLYPPALIGPFIGGFLATRSSYIVGGVIGILVVIMFGLFVFVTPAPEYGTDRKLLAVANTLYMIPAGALFAASAAFYRRYLRLISPPPGQRGGSRSGRPSR